MKLGHLYNQIVRFGKEADPRKGVRIDSYADTALLFGDPRTEVKKVMVGIDIEVGELILADRLRKTAGLDLVISHHPEGRAWAALDQVMRMQVDMLVAAGISRSAAQGMMDERAREVARRLMPHNHMRSVDVARLLDIPFMCVHTPADNHASLFIERLFKRERPDTVGEIVDMLLEIPEYARAARENAGPRLILGSPCRRAGRIFVEMTGGTEGPAQAYGGISKAGVRTLVSMHLSEESFKKVRDADLNVVIAGHVSSDTLGLNLILDKVEREERLETVDCSGFRRVRRKPMSV